MALSNLTIIGIVIGVIILIILIVLLYIAFSSGSPVEHFGTLQSPGFALSLK